MVFFFIPHGADFGAFGAKRDLYIRSFIYFIIDIIRKMVRGREEGLRRLIRGCDDKFSSFLFYSFFSPSNKRPTDYGQNTTQQQDLVLFLYDLDDGETPFFFFVYTLTLTISLERGREGGRLYPFFFSSFRFLMFTLFLLKRLQRTLSFWDRFDIEDIRPDKLEEESEVFEVGGVGLRGVRWLSNHL